MIIIDLEQRLQVLWSTRVHVQSTLSNLEALIQECSTQLQHLTTTADSTEVAVILPSLLQMSASFSKTCSDESDLIVPGPYLTREKLASLITMARAFQGQVKEYIKSTHLHTLMSRAIKQRRFCDQLRRLLDSITNIDMVTTMICLKLIVKLLTGSGDEQQQSQQNVKMDSDDDGLNVAVLRKCSATNGDSPREAFPGEIRSWSRSRSDQGKASSFVGL